MNINTEEILDEILDKMRDIMKIRTGDFPNIDLYMDQVTTFMDEKLRYTVRKGETEEKILTKTMINNYAKNDLLPAPYKKKYNREHMMVLIFVYYFKNFLTINDVRTLLEPITENYFGNDDALNMVSIYEEVFRAGEDRLDLLEQDLKDKYQASGKTFQDENLPEEEAEYLRLFSYICFLSYDIFVKKMLIERLLDEVGDNLRQQQEAKKEEAKRKDKEKVKDKEKSKEKEKEKEGKI
ncbi:MAG: DUF1836 domain-containing protein [Lachnospiraceae bacterium]|nr:DUF1836 domain-containing protein [Lachnospiraceae bacterium]